MTAAAPISANAETPHRLRWVRLRRELAPVTAKSLTQTLRRLERNGVISREVIGTYPRAVDYAITPLGRGLEEPLQQTLVVVRPLQ